MKPFLAYTLLVIGLPMLVGIFVGGVLTAPVMMTLHRSTAIRLPNMLFLEVVHGFVASLAAACLFRLFALTPGLSVPIIMSIWVTLYFFTYHQPKRAWVSWLAGIFTGWFTLSQVILLA